MISKVLLALGLTASISGFASPVAAEPKVCVFDYLGQKGPIANLAQDYALEGRKNGYGFRPVIYTNESVAAKDFEIGKCDGLVATGIRTRRYNSFTGSLDAIGGLPSYDAVLVALKSMGSPQLQAVMVQGDYEVGGVLPFGSAFIFVRDKELNSLAKVAGKKIAALAHDESQIKLIQAVGAQPVAADVSNFGSYFNNGVVDVIVAPSIAYRPLELYRGIKRNGAVVRFPVAMVTYQIIMRRSKFEPEAGQKLRQYVAREMPRALEAVQKIDRLIPEKVFVDLAPADQLEYTQMMREARIELSREGIYNACTLRLMKKVRCAVDQTTAECRLPESYPVPASCPISAN